MKKPLKQRIAEWVGWKVDSEGAIRALFNAAGTCIGFEELALEEFHRMLDREYVSAVHQRNKGERK